jgi:hypothetical protein
MSELQWAELGNAIRSGALKALMIFTIEGMLTFLWYQCIYQS